MEAVLPFLHKTVMGNLERERCFRCLQTYFLTVMSEEEETTGVKLDK